MRYFILILFSIVCFSCKNETEERKIMYKQLIHYRDELKMNSINMEGYIEAHADENEWYKKMIEKKLIQLENFENQFEKAKYKEREEIVNLRNSFKKDNRLVANFETSEYSENIPDTVFNRLMEIDFYRLKTEFQVRYLMIKGCKF